MAWTVYVARCGDGSLYTGITTDPDRRVLQHNAGSGSAYTRSRLPVTLVYSERWDDRAQALRREYAIKRLSRREKEALVGGQVLRSTPSGEDPDEVRRSVPV